MIQEKSNSETKIIKQKGGKVRRKKKGCTFYFPEAFLDIVSQAPPPKKWHCQPIREAASQTWYSSIRLSYSFPLKEILQDQKFAVGLWLRY